ncbi:MAG: cell division protein FtsZ, partial [Oscillibacter sp.]|nr:cell division protein FtsZ [Oscillibacter sp.]
EVEQAASLVQQAVHPDALTIFGATFDETMDDEIRVTVIATGFEKVDSAVAAPKAEAKQQVVTAAAPAPLAEEDLPQAAEPEEPDPFDDIFKIFNRRD